MKAFRLLRIIPFVMAGVLIAAWLMSGREPPGRVELAERRVVAHTIVAVAAPVRPIARGHGNVQPVRIWTAVAEVAGTVTWRHPGLENGNVLAAGTEVLRIDPTLYVLTIAQTEADLAALMAE
ncbi:MAG: efflux RND transporter periplasmic adaptor subunit, partial [Alphaproteobacteria bacterium]